MLKLDYICNMKRYRDTEYFVSQDGKVIGPKGYELKGETNNSGYKRCSIYINKKIKKFSIHRMVAECYISNPEKKPDVNHIDGNKLNNVSSNLEWNTKKENMEHAYKNNLINTCKGENQYLSKLTENDISFIRNNYIPRDKKFGMRALSRKFNVSYGTIYPLIHNKTWKHIK